MVQRVLQEEGEMGIWRVGVKAHNLVVPVAGVKEGV